MESDRYKSMTKPPDAVQPKRRVVDKIGQRYGRLTVIAAAPARKKASVRSDTGTARWETYWRVRCDCGNEREICAHHLTTGHAKSCGCLRIEILASPDPVAISYARWKENVSRLTKWTNKLTRQDYERLISGNCYYCGSAPSLLIPHSRGKLRNTIDRVDSTKGYEIENCVSCCLLCNRMKRNLAKQDYVAHVLKVALYQLVFRLVTPFRRT